MLIPVVLSGGSGTRLWPVSRRLHPKQLLPLVGDATMLQQTVERLRGLSGLESPLVACNAQQSLLVQEQLADIDAPAAAILVEPMGRNTAPAVALAALAAQASTPAGEPSPLLLVLPADHVVLDEPAFRTAVDEGRPLAEAGKLVTFGVVPRSAHTGYGYIKAATPGQPSRVRSFVEKPNAATAQRYLDSGGYYWNSGMFLFSAATYLEELRQHRPKMREACERAFEAATRRGVVVDVDADAFEACPSDSIDYAVMEKTSRAVVVPLDAGWSDVGSWAALHEVGTKDADDNVCEGDVIATDCRGTLLHARHRLLTAVGLQDMVVVETADSVLVAPRKRSQQVKGIVETLRGQGRVEAEAHPIRHHAWGRQEHLGTSVGADVGAVEIRPGQVLAGSHDRDRCWVVTVGQGTLRQGDDTRDLRPGVCVRVPAATPYEMTAGDEFLKLVIVDLPEPPA
ncbi:MAG: mannose-1-phosphate guanylyltransferase/mannose-6-phosphate isomerase [Myxococcota bacterium]